MSRCPFPARLLAGLALSMALSGAAMAQRTGSGYVPSPVPTEGIPPELVKIDIDVNKLGATVPLDLPFVDETGATRTLREVLSKDRPTILQLGYMRCPQLCSLVLNKLVSGLKGVTWSIGDEFEVLCVSINPDEGFELAAAKKQGYVVDYGRPGSAKGWHFLTGPASSSQALADAVGFGFERQPDGEYAHAACLFVLTPDGRVSRQLYGAEQKPGTLRMALLEASDGTIGTIVDRFILWCHVYDPNRNSYAWFSFRLMQIGGIITMLAIVGGVAWMRWRDVRQERLAPPLDETHGSGRQS